MILSWSRQIAHSERLIKKLRTLVAELLPAIGQRYTGIKSGSTLLGQFFKVVLEVVTPALG
jgi:hypothetical protein